MPKASEFCVPWLAGGTDWSEPEPTGEWLVTNGLGGYAAGSLVSRPTRRYHGLLVAALSEPAGRFMLLNDLAEHLHLATGMTISLTGPASNDADKCDRAPAVCSEFTTELGLPIWRYELEDVGLERRLLMPQCRNATLVRYEVHRCSGAVRFRLRPFFHFRRFNEPVTNEKDGGPYEVEQIEAGLRLQLKHGLPQVRLTVQGARVQFTAKAADKELVYPLERSRASPDRGRLWSPGFLAFELGAGTSATLIASAEDEEQPPSTPEEILRAERSRREVLLAKARPEVRSGIPAQLVLAADQFLFKPVAQPSVVTKMKSRGEEARSVIAGYYRFADWGRDSLISLEGLCLTTGQPAEARKVLLTFAAMLQDGLIPTQFPEGGKPALYYSADGSFWLFHALDRYVEATGDRALVRQLLPDLCGIVEHYVKGTRHNIGVDPADGLVRGGSEEYPLTWMDAHIKDWIVTPRRGKPVEINALWYNSLRLLERWLRELDENGRADDVAGRAQQVWMSFNERYWFEEGGHLFDVVDGPEGDCVLCRPNQIVALSLRYPVLDQERWRPVFEVVTDRLLTPVGLRSLAPGSPGYRPYYFGDIRSRDASYHQGTVWPWLLGPYVDAWMRIRPEEKQAAHAFLNGVLRDLGQSCLGSLNEIHDGELPFTPRGSVAQAWSVAEVLRSIARTETAAPAVSELHESDGN